MTKIGARTKTALLMAGIAAGGSAAHAGGFYLQEQSVKAAGRAFSGEAADQGADSLWWNPAAIAGNATSTAYLGASAILPTARVVDRGTLIVRPGQAPASVGGDPLAKNPISKGLVPSGAIGYRLNDQVALGLAIGAPFSFTTNYDADSWVRYTADKSKLRTFDIQPSIAFAPNEWLGLGAALNIEYSDAELSNALPNLSPLLADGSQVLKGDGWDLGWSAGAQLKPNDRVTFGISYKSSIRHKLKGDVTIAGLLGPLAAQNRTVDATATFRTPWQLIMGTRLKATDRLTLNAQVVRIGWSKFDAIRLGAPLNTAIPENYRNTWSVAGGLDYALDPQWTVRTGIQFDQTPTRDGERDARVPDTNRINFALGTSYRMSDSFTIDAAANYIKFKNGTIDRPTAAYAGTPVQTPILVNGAVRKASAVLLAIGGRLSF